MELSGPGKEGGEGENLADKNTIEVQKELGKKEAKGATNASHQ